MLRRGRVLYALVALCGTLVWAACSNPHLAGGKLHFDQMRFERAKENFQLAVEETPENAEAWLWLGRAHAELGEVEPATDAFQKARELDERIADDVKNTREHYWSERFNSALAYAGEANDIRVGGGDATEKYRAALDESQRAATYNPEAVGTHTLIGKIYFNLGEVDSAMAVFNKVSEMAPDDEEINLMLLGVYKDQGNQAFSRALDAKQIDKDVARAEEMFETARAFYTKAYRIQVDDVDVNQNLGAVDWELADLSPENPERKQELLQEALGHYEAVLKAEPENADVIQNLSILHNELGNQEQALEYAERFVDADPKFGRAHLNQGRLRGETGDKVAMFGDLLIGQAIDQGIDVPTAQARAEAEKHGPSSDMLNRWREAGDPEEIRQYTEGGSQYQVWFYWTRGAAYAFEAGKEIYAKRFASVEPEEEVMEEASGE